MDSQKTACFTGHRDISEPKELVKNRILNIVEGLILKRYYYFCAGGARGFDMLASKAVLQLRKKYPQIQLILVLPFCNQYQHESGWTDKEIAEYHYLESAADKTVYLQEKYSKGCYYKRNRFLVDYSTVCIAYQHKNSGGTAYTTRYAMEHGVSIINCAPNTI